MKNTNKQNTDQENSDSLLNERGDVTCSEGEAVTELSPSSGSDFYTPLTPHEEYKNLITITELYEKWMVEKSLNQRHLDDFFSMITNLKTGFKEISWNGLILSRESCQMVE